MIFEWYSAISTYTVQKHLEKNIVSGQMFMIYYVQWPIHALSYSQKILFEDLTAFWRQPG